MGFFNLKRVYDMTGSHSYDYFNYNSGLHELKSQSFYRVESTGRLIPSKELTVLGKTLGLGEQQIEQVAATIKDERYYKLCPGYLALLAICRSTANASKEHSSCRDVRFFEYSRDYARRKLTDEGAKSTLEWLWKKAASEEDPDLARFSLIDLAINSCIKYLNQPEDEDRYHPDDFPRVAEWVVEKTKQLPKSAQDSIKKFFFTRFTHSTAIDQWLLDEEYSEPIINELSNINHFPRYIVTPSIYRYMKKKLNALVTESLDDDEIEILVQIARMAFDWPRREIVFCSVDDLDEKCARLLLIPGVYAKCKELLGGFGRVGSALANYDQPIIDTINQNKRISPAAMSLLRMADDRNFLSNDCVKRILTLSVKEAKDFYEAWEHLKRIKSSLATKQNFNVLLANPRQALNIADLFAGDGVLLSNVSLYSSLRSIEGILGQQVALSDKHRDSWFNLYRSLQKHPEFDFDLTTIKAMLQLTEQELKWVQELAELKPPPKIEHMNAVLNDTKYSPVAHWLAEKVAVAKLYNQAEQVRISSGGQRLPAPGDYESSMDDKFIVSARTNIEKVKEKYPELGEKVATEKKLADVESEIREMLLKRILAESQDNTEVKTFLTAENIKKLAARSDADLNKKAVGLFTAKDNTAQTAWRAYEPLAEVANWPNLLTKPDSSSAKARVFSTMATTHGTDNEGKDVTQDSAANDVRRLAALCFLASQDKQAVTKESVRKSLEDSFVHYVAEIRRAHNSGNIGTDNPSCYPGCISRLGQILTVHPLFAKEESSEEVDENVSVSQEIENVIRASLQEVISNRLSDLAMGSERRLLLSAINLYSIDTADSLATSKDNVELNLSWTDDDILDAFNNSSVDTLLWPRDTLNEADEVEAKAAYLEQVKAERQRLMADLCGEDGSKIFDLVKDRLTRKKALFVDEEISYLIAKNLANLPRLVGIPGELLEAVRSPEHSASQNVEQNAAVEEEAIVSSNNPFGADPSMAGPYKVIAFNKLREHPHSIDFELAEDWVNKLFQGSAMVFFQQGEQAGVKMVGQKSVDDILKDSALPDNISREKFELAIRDAKAFIGEIDKTTAPVDLTQPSQARDNESSASGQSNKKKAEAPDVFGDVPLKADDSSRFDASVWDVPDLARPDINIEEVLTKAYEKDYKDKKRELEGNKESPKPKSWPSRDSLHAKLLKKLNALRTTPQQSRANGLKAALDFLYAAQNSHLDGNNDDPELRTLLVEANTLDAVKGKGGYWDSVIAPFAQALATEEKIQAQKAAQAAQIKLLHDSEAAYQHICDEIQKIEQDTSENFDKTAEQKFPGLKHIWEQSTEDTLEVNLTNWMQTSNDELAKEREILDKERKKYQERQQSMQTDQTLEPRAVLSTKKISQDFIDRYCAKKAAIFAERARIKMEEEQIAAAEKARVKAEAEQAVAAEKAKCDELKLAESYKPNLDKLADNFCHSLKEEWTEGIPCIPKEYAVKKLQQLQGIPLEKNSPNYYSRRMALAILCYYIRSEKIPGRKSEPQASRPILSDQAIKYLQEHANEADKKSDKTSYVQKVELMLTQLENGNYIYLQQEASVNTGFGYRTDGKDIFKDKTDQEPLLVQQMKMAIKRYNNNPNNAQDKIDGLGKNKQAYEYLMSRATAAAEILDATNEKVQKVNQLIKALSSGDADKVAKAAAIKTGWWGKFVDATGVDYFPDPKRKPKM